MSNTLNRRQWSGNQIDSGNTPVIGAAVYYGITAAIVVAIAVAIVVGKIVLNRRHRKQVARRIDLERQEQTRRGEAGGLPTYLENGGTTAVPMPTLPYPDPSYRPAGAHETGLPGYEMSAPPKYDYPAPAPTRATPGQTLQVPQNDSTEMQESRSGVSVTTPLASPVAERPNFFVRNLSHRSNGGEMESVPLDGPASTQRQ